MDPHIHQEFPDFVEPFRILLQPARQDLVLNAAQLLLGLHQNPQVPGNQRFQKIVKEPFQRREPPSFHPADHFDDIRRVLAVFNENDPLFVQRKGESVRPSAHLRAPGHVKAARQRVEVDDCLRLQHIRGIHVHINDHVKLVFRPGPGFRVHDDDIGRISGLSVNNLLGTALLKHFSNLVVHSFALAAHCMKNWSIVGSVICPTQ